MDTYKFEDIARFLKMGREIEFSYRHKQYSITNRDGMWIFCCDTDGVALSELCAYGSLEELAWKAAGVQIQDMEMKRIFDDALYDRHSVCIL